MAGDIRRADGEPNAREALSGFLHLEADDQTQRLDVTAAAYANLTADVKLNGASITTSSAISKGR